MATSLYCSIDDVENILSEQGVTLRVDDSPPTTNGNILDRASRRVDGYLLRRYREERLAESPWVQHATAVLAAVLLCGRRGNPIPSSLKAEWDEYKEELQRIRTENADLADVPERATSLPQLNNGHIQEYPTPRHVTAPGRSMMDPPDYQQNRDRLHPSDYYTS